MEDFPVLCVGLVCIDKFLKLDSFPLEDSDQPALEAHQARGGNASNNCTVLSQLVPKVEFLGTLPKPQFGNQYDFVVNDFKSCRISLNTECPIRYNCDWPEATVILNAKSGTRTIIYNPGQQDCLDCNEFIAAVKDKKYSWIHFEGRPNVKEMLIWMKNKRSNGRGDGISLEIEKPNETLKSLMFHAINFKMIDVLFVSKDVSMYLGAKSLKEAVKLFKNYDLHQIMVIFTWADQGAAGIDINGQEVFVSAASTIDGIVDTCGAGDTFTSGVISSLLRDFNLETAMQTGCIYAAKKIQQKGLKNLHLLQQQR